MDGVNNNIDKKKRGRKPLIQVIEFNIPEEYRNAVTYPKPLYSIPTRLPGP